ncbi:two-component system response regulator [Thiomicrorhabdus immobilis]|uniref:Two-component system response regulator n=1 Tax=Thiomicrorhabdus immobilis TaxID=2791037 RepID=A0ABM7MAQ1_9GAMM|nr:EAL domain-containing protein [Thiomicrorhabdus immobilis]BCN92424.1 two-component system response regulator [Thiomicrorhabdus immobilis]
MLSTTANPPLILVIEDDPVTRLTVSKVLRHYGYQVIDAKNGREGFSSYIENKPNLILLDAMMPEMNGYEAIKAIRNYELEHSVPILMLTSLEDTESIELAFDSGATDFITKPLNWELLAQRVKYALRSSEIEEKLRRSQSQLIFAQKLAKLGYWEWDATTDEVSGSESAFALFGIPKQTGISLEQFLSNILPKDKPIIQQAIAEAGQGQSHIQISFRILQHDGNLTHIECLGEVTFDRDNQIIKITGSAQDISRLHKAESLIQYQSQHDSLTELPNRASFTATVNEYLTNQSSQRLSAVIIFDIDRFKQINENLGQEQGDQLLTSLAQRLSRITREGDFVARLGSDEFAVLITNLQSQHELNLLLNRFSQDLNAPFIIDQKELFISYSIGISIFPDDADNSEILLKNANIARTTAKSRGGNQFIFYKPELNDNAQDILALENDLRRALQNNEIEVFYQPQVDANTLVPTGSEALVRWRHPSRGIIPPGIFIPIAESTGMIIEIGKFVLETAVKDTETWHSLGYSELHIGINLSSRQFTQSNLMELVQHVVTNTTLPAHFIDLEITESLAMSNAETNINILNGLKAIGASLSIDDFGTGYSSLAYLHSFPIDTIKIDRSFVINLDTKEGQAIAKTILAMADSLKLSVVAEGIETKEQQAFLQSHNCNILQGYKFGKPMPKDEFTVWLQKYNTL